MHVRSKPGPSFKVNRNRSRKDRMENIEGSIISLGHVRKSSGTNTQCSSPLPQRLRLGETLS